MGSVSCPEGQEKEWWHPSHHWSSMHHGQGTRGQAEMVRAYTTERRRWLCQTNLRGGRSWTTKSRKTEKEMDRRRQVQHGGLVPHAGGHRESCWMEKENPYGWPLTRGIHSLKEREGMYHVSTNEEIANWQSQIWKLSAAHKRNTEVINNAMLSGLNAVAVCMGNDRITSKKN